MKRPIYILSIVFVLLIIPLVAGASSVQYTYDSLHRLIEVDYGNGNVIQYTYDENGNRGTQVVTAASGSITVTISPQAAVAAGAEWRVDSGYWYDTGGKVSGLSAGQHTVSFSDISGWTTPGSQTVSVSNGQTVSLTGTYVQQAGGLWQNATDAGGGWEYLSPFGFFKPSASAWIYHQTLGWLYPVGTSTDSIWFYDPQWDGTGGWWWSGSSLFPWVYSVTESEWLYFDAKDSAPGARWFFTGAGEASTH